MAEDTPGGDIMTSSDFLNSESQIPSYRAERLRPRISLTSDVLDFRKCERKYGLYKVRNFQASAPTAEFVGTFAHRSLEKAWREAREGNSPNQDRMIKIMEDIRMQMVNEEKRNPHSWNAVLKAGRQVMRMHASLAARGMYATLFDSERRFRSLEGDFVLEGVVDALFEHDGNVMLWDWKASNDPRAIIIREGVTERSLNYAQRVIDDYSLQLRIYHHLYSRVIGITPQECRIIFLGEMPVEGEPLRKRKLVDAWAEVEMTPLSDEEWAAFEKDSSDPSRPGLFYTVSTTTEDIESAVAEFHSTASEIITCRDVDRWEAPEQDCLPDRQTCQDCDFRESCPALKDVV